MSDTEHLFMYALAICMSSLMMFSQIDPAFLLPSIELEGLCVSLVLYIPERKLPFIFFWCFFICRCVGRAFLLLPLFLFLLPFLATVLPLFLLTGEIYLYKKEKWALVSFQGLRLAQSHHVYNKLKRAQRKEASFLTNWMCDPSFALGLVSELPKPVVQVCWG